MQTHQDKSSRKKIYFIRHGESEGNAGPIRQSAASHLTDHGKAQAAFMGERCMSLPLEVLVSSTMMRAQETAEIISEKTGHEIISSPLFMERRRPSYQTGKDKDDPMSREIDQLVFNNFAKPGYRHSDEENFDDLKARAIAALRYLGDRPEEHIGVVTHGFFMRVVMAVVVFGETLTARECERFLRTFHMENTGLTVIGFDGWNRDPAWWVWTWNDHGHLG
jgi:broad specificity phosphatase PhoE